MERAVFISDRLVTQAIEDAFENLGIIVPAGANLRDEVRRIAGALDATLPAPAPHRNDRAYLKRKKGRS